MAVDDGVEDADGVRLHPAKRPAVVSTRLRLCRGTNTVRELDLITILLLSLIAREGDYIGLLIVTVDLRLGLGGLFVIAVTLAIVLLVVFTPSIVSVAVVRLWVVEVVDVVAFVVYVVFVVGTVSIGALLSVLSMSPLRPEHTTRTTHQINQNLMRTSDQLQRKVLRTRWSWKVRWITGWVTLVQRQFNQVA